MYNCTMYGPKLGIKTDFTVDTKIQGAGKSVFTPRRRSRRPHNVSAGIVSATLHYWKKIRYFWRRKLAVEERGLQESLKTQRPTFPRPGFRGGVKTVFTLRYGP